MTVTAEAFRLAEVLYEYHRLRHEPRPADVILVLGSNDLRVAEFAADLYHRGFGPRVVFSGGVAHQGDLLATGWEEPEADRFAAVAMERGVPKQAILLERESTNTALNIRNSRALLAADPPRSVVIAVKTFMQRRAWATFAVEWPEMPATVASPNLSFSEFCLGSIPIEDTIHVLVGDTQRLGLYAGRGWSAPQRMPDEVGDAYERLNALGFTRHLLR